MIQLEETHTNMRRGGGAEVMTGEKRTGDKENIWRGGGEDRED